MLYYPITVDADKEMKVSEMSEDSAQGIWWYNLSLILHLQLAAWINFASLVNPTAVVPLAGKPQLTFPCLNLSKINKDGKQQLQQRLHAESIDMIDTFQHLFSATTKSLKQRNIPVKELLRSLVGLTSAHKDLNLAFKQQFPELTKAKTIDDAMLMIGNYCSFFNFHMVEHIIIKLGTKQDKENLAKYIDEFNKYAKRCVLECPFELGTVSHGLVNMFVTLDQTIDSGFTMRILQIFVENLRKTLKISTGAVFKLCHIEPGSLKLTFQLHFSALQDIFPLSSKQEAALTGLGVESLWIIYQFNKNTGVYCEETTTGEQIKIIL